MWPKHFKTVQFHEKKISSFLTVWDHPFKTSAFFTLGKGGGVKNLPNLQTGSSKKMPMEGGRGQKLGQFADILNG